MKQQKNFSASQPSSPPVYIVSKKNKKIGLFLLLGPIIAIIVVVAIYALVTWLTPSTVVDTSVEGGTSLKLMATDIVNMVLGLLGVVCVIGVIICVPLGIIYLRKKELVDGKNIMGDQTKNKPWTE